VRKRREAGLRPGDATEALIERTLTGDVRAFEALVTQHYGQVYAFACRMVGAEAAEDVAQDVFLRVYRALPSYRGDASFTTWLYRITHNTCLDYRRRQRRERERSLSLDGTAGSEEAAPLEWLAAEDSAGADPQAQAEALDLHAKLQQALMRLSDKHRAVLVLHDVHGFRYEEIKDIVGCSLGTVRSRLYYARRELKRLLQEMWPGEFEALLVAKERQHRAGGAPPA